MGAFTNLIKSERQSCIRDDWDLWVLWTGIAGTGKSWAALKLCEEVDPDFCIENIVFNTEDLAARARLSPKGACLVLDEGIRGGMSREFMTSRNRGLLTFGATGRYHNNVVFILNPLKGQMDKTVIDRVKYWVHMVARGKALPHKGGNPVHETGRRRSFAKLPSNGFNVDSVPPKCWPEYLAKKAQMGVDAEREAEGKYVPLEKDLAEGARKIRIILGLND